MLIHFKRNKDGDVVITLGAGDVWKKSAEILKVLNEVNRSEISKIVSGKILQNEPMSRHTTFRIGGKCDFILK